MIIGICGWIGSGKDTAADYLVNFHQFKRESFAGALKDAVACVFGWDREMLEGKHRSAREARDMVDGWWAKRLGIPDLTPRWVLQQFGTEVFRGAFHDEIWIAALERRLGTAKDNIVISDCRFPNEINAIRHQGGRVIWIKRGNLPEWYDTAHQQLTTGESLMSKNYPTIHPSEYSWIATEFDAVIDNSGSIEDLYEQLKNLV